MGTLYNQLTQIERYQIQTLHELQFSARAIAKKLDRSNKTISLELKRCHGNYCAEMAHRLSRQKRQDASKYTQLNMTQRQNLDWLLSLDLSPEQIAGRMKLESFDAGVSQQTLYRWIVKLNWRSRLPRKGKRYRKRAGLQAGASLIPNRTDIDERPAIVEQNSELGHWEGDTVYGQDSYFVTLVERVSKIFISTRVPNKTKKTVGRAIRKLLKPYRSMCKTITFDNGGEFAGHAEVSRALKCKIYFAKPYQSWQRGLNENTNGLLRRYFPKGMAIALLSSQQIKEAIFKINLRPRKVLNYLSPIEFLLGKRVSLMLRI